MISSIPTYHRSLCPAINTLANHEYIPRDGVTRPWQHVAAVQEAFNMGNGLAKAQAYGVHLINGNMITDLMSNWAKYVAYWSRSPQFGVVGGLSDHNTFEGYASITRGKNP